MTGRAFVAGTAIALASAALTGWSGGVRTAEGCGGAPSGINGEPIGVWLERGAALTTTPELSPGGPILFKASYPPEQADTLIEALEVTVTNAASETIPGNVRVLWSAEGEHLTRLLVGWEPASPLVAGQSIMVTYSASVGTMNDSSGWSFVVAEAPPAAAPPSLQLGEWETLVVGRGPTTTCRSFCSVSTFHTQELSLQQLSATLTHTAPRQLVAWALSLESTSELEPEALAEAIFAGGEEAAAHETQLRAVLEAQPAEACFVPVLTDLTTGERYEGQEVCKPAAPSVVTTNLFEAALGDCVEAPDDPTLLDRWCRARGSAAPSEQCPQPAGAGAPAPGPGVTMGDSTPSESAPRSSQSCSLAPSPHSSSAPWIAALLSVAALCARRRRHP